MSFRLLQAAEQELAEQAAAMAIAPFAPKPGYWQGRR